VKHSFPKFKLKENEILKKKKDFTFIILLIKLNAFANVSDIAIKPKISLVIDSFPSNNVGQLANTSEPLLLSRFNCV